MKFDIAAMIRRARNPRRRQIILRPIIPTSAQAASLYAAAYRPVIAAWQGAVERIAATYERSIPVRDAIHDSIFDLDAIFAALEGELSRIVLSITPVLKEWAVRVEGWQRGKWRGSILTATGIDLGTVLSPGDVADTVDAFISQNVGLVKSVSDQARERIHGIVFRGYQERAPARVIAKEMSEAVGLGRKRALRIASDQTTKLAARLDQARQEQAGIDRFKWRWSHKLHGRAIHIAHDGKVFAWDDLPQVDGKDDAPGRLPYCGCRAQAVISLD